MSINPGAEEELQRGRKLVLGLKGETISSVTLDRFGVEHALFLARNVSKLSPLIASLLEIRTVELLNKNSADDWRWERQDPVFPDADLRTKGGVSTGAGFEIKAWHALSTELTGRFRESRARLEGKQIDVLVVAWVLDHLIWGTPRILGVVTTSAVSVAEARDHHYYDPPDYLIVEPGDTADRTSNLQQTQVAGYRLQEGNMHIRESAAALVRAAGPEALDPYSSAAESLVALLMSRYDYRLETNFAKIDRIQHDEVEAFKASMLSVEMFDRPLSGWAGVFRDLSKGTGQKQGEAQEALSSLLQP